MSKKTIRMRLTGRDIGRAIREVEAYNARLETKAKEVARRLAEIGLQVASVRFANAQYDGTNDASVSIEPTENGYRVVAQGESVCFIEFGTGVHYNGFGGTYPIPKPAGISGIGQFGRGRGSDDSWRYHGDPGTNGVVVSNDPLATEPYVVTQGNPANMPMYLALSEMRDGVERIVKEVFASG